MNKFVKKLLSSTLALFFMGANLNIVSAIGSENDTPENIGAHQGADTIQQSNKMVKYMLFLILSREDQNYSITVEKTDIDDVILCKNISGENGDILLDVDKALSLVEEANGSQLPLSEKVKYCAIFLQVFLDTLDTLAQDQDQDIILNPGRAINLIEETIEHRQLTINEKADYYSTLLVVFDEFEQWCNL